jgi:hypothetical protein
MPKLTAPATMVILSQATSAASKADAMFAITSAPLGIQDTNVKMEVISAGLIPTNDYGVSLEVIAGLPYETNDGSVKMEVIAQTTLSPAKPMTTITWFTPS